MKSNKLFLLSFFILIICSYFAAAIYNISYDCPDECVKNKTIAWNITITNKGESNFDIVYIKLIDSINKKTIVKTEEAELTINDPNTIGSNKSAIITITPSNHYSFTFESILPLPNYNSDLIYNFCLTVRNPLHAWGKIGPSREYCYKENHTIEMIDCTSDNDCSFNDYCINNTCYPLNCTECQYIGNHTCIDYSCCNDNNCRLNESCIGYECKLLNCNETILIENQSNDFASDKTVKTSVETTDTSDEIGDNTIKQGVSYQRQHIVNHTCSFTPCKEDELLVDYTCIESNCSEDEFILNYACKKLNCSFDEGFVNHTCQKLDCKEGEGIINNRCVPLECADDEAIINYKCKKLNCIFFQKAEANNCLINTTLFMEFMLLIIIAFLFILDIMKYSGKHRKSLVSMLLKKAKQRGDESKKQ